MNRITGHPSKVATMIAPFYNQRKKVSLQSDCYPRTEEAIRLIKRKESCNINQSDYALHYLHSNPIETTYPFFRYKGNWQA